MSVNGAQADGYKRKRATSDASALMTSNQTLSSYHPALSLPEFVNTFGPLIFTLYRAALLRKRVLFVGEAPVQQNCDFGKLPRDVPTVVLLTNCSL